MSKLIVNAKSFLEQPCERCGSPKKTSKSWTEEIDTALGTSTIEVSQTICTNKTCQDLFDKMREEEIVKINERKQNKEVQDKIRRENIAKTIAARRKKLA
jgi:hypothetical protein